MNKTKSEFVILTFFEGNPSLVETHQQTKGFPISMPLPE